MTAPSPGAPRDRASGKAAEPPAIPLAFPLSCPDPMVPSPELAQLRATCPVAPVRLPTGAVAHLVTRYADNLAVLGDGRFSRAAAAAASAPRARNIPLDPDAVTVKDPPDHTRLRRAIAAAVTPRRLEMLDGLVTGTTHDLIDTIVTDGGGDLVDGFAQPLAMTVITGLLGLPRGEGDLLRGLTRDYLRGGREAAGAAAGAAAELDAYFADEVHRRRGRVDGGDVFSTLAAARDSDAMSDGELRSFAVTLLVAGYETVAAHLACSLVVLIDRRESWHWNHLVEGQVLRAPVVEELLRFVPMAATGGTIRVATADVEVGGVLVRAGDAVLPALTSANRDPAVFSHPDEFRPHRFPNPHVSFGHGMHRCLGAHLARMQLRTGLGAVLSRLSNLRLVEPLADLAWNTHSPMRSPRGLRVTVVRA